MGQFGYICVFVDICVFPLGMVGSPVFLWAFLGFLGFLKFKRSVWVILGTFGFSWVSVHFLWVWLIPLGFFRLFCSCIGHFEYIWVLMSICRFGGFPWVTLGFLGFFRFFVVPKYTLGTFGFS